MVYEHAKDHKFYDGIIVIDFDILNTIKGMVRNFEAKNTNVAIIRIGRRCAGNGFFRRRGNWRWRGGKRAWWLLRAKNFWKGGKQKYKHEQGSDSH